MKTVQVHTGEKRNDAAAWLGACPGLTGDSAAPPGGSGCCWLFPVARGVAWLPCCFCVLLTILGWGQSSAYPACPWSSAAARVAAGNDWNYLGGDKVM